jgi:hypothetical protein
MSRRIFRTTARTVSRGGPATPEAARDMYPTNAPHLRLLHRLDHQCFAFTWSLQGTAAVPTEGRCRLWKVVPQRLADQTGLVLTVSHFPPATNRWNKIAHRVSPNLAFLGITYNNVASRAAKSSHASSSASRLVNRTETQPPTPRLSRRPDRRRHGLASRVGVRTCRVRPATGRGRAG